MKPLILAIVACCGALCAAVAFAAPDYPAAGNVQNSNKLVETVDSGGGGAPAQAASSARPGAAASADRGINLLRDVASGPDSDPSTPAAATPRRPTYRWQSLVPGAIK